MILKIEIFICTRYTQFCAVHSTKCTIVYCTVQFCTVLCCIVLYCTVLYCTVLSCTDCNVLYCTALSCSDWQNCWRRDVAQVRRIFAEKYSPKYAGILFRKWKCTPRYFSKISECINYILGSVSMDNIGWGLVRNWVIDRAVCCTGYARVAPTI